ncbi:acidic phospholipase A2 PA4 [Drosophila innubila]|uniref:acidic phospholipase A2 PA4 n=1 Tax=Drosophila innubila TaxID=198719 RepID=UPI00148CF58A|nr:acidic phospholipase A2 PA4 [Drosophila innubila]
MAFLNKFNCNYIYVLCLIICAWQMCVAKQLPLPANVAAAAAATGSTINVGRSNGTSSNNSGADSDAGVHQRRHESYVADIDDESVAAVSVAVGERSQRQRRQASDWFIAPNTRWCGKGNLANGTYNQLGGASMADKCCRKHDHCKKYIPALSNRYDLFNYRPYTLSHCSCDRRFRTCLKMASDEDANTIGKLFFNMVQTQCFILKTESICLQHGTGDTCLKMELRTKAYLKDNLKF